MAASTVKVKDIQGKEYSLRVANPARTTLWQFKSMLQQQSGIQSIKQGLIFNKQSLDDNDNNKTLTQLQIGDGSCLHIVVKSGWTVRVNDLMNPGRTLEVFVEGRSSELGSLKKVVDIKQVIVKIQGEGVLKLHEIRLMMNSRELRDNSTLSECGITNNCTIDMKKKFLPPWNILVQGIQGKSYNLLIKQENPEETTIATLKQLLKDKTGLTPEEQRLCFGPKPLENHHTLEHHNIGNNSTLFLVVRLRGGAGTNVQGMIALLRESPTTTINNIANCPMFRACPHCGTLLEHTGGCNNMQCWSCKKHFCFVCLAIPTASGSSSTPSCNSRCTAPANRQTSIKT